MCYFYRNPPPGSGVKPQPYKAIPKLIGAPNMRIGRVDAVIFACFKRARQPLGSLVEAHDVWKALPASLRNKVTMRTVANRLREKGFTMQEKLAGDDKGE